ncbi:hypothetical protein Pla52o_53100 [Novipirellula galeiformis]|uniref:Translocation protein TolB n=1 Tax=Novipirellula galeiformis TaxID=2528004 RepID=A0A5C6C249_9BACT|nr:hypothetical protein [Novipirellula galeiformis]TWU17304.1 hypothetical protein Pla52o_53100 [Novipirellula galeiformis]
MSRPSIDRRQFIASQAAIALAACGANPLAAATSDLEIPVRTITKGPKHHWFGYYDKHQFDPTNRFVLGMQVDFEHRSPTADDTIKIGMIDLEDGDRWIELGESKAWGWQQGCMLQWLPGSDSEIIWNDRIGDRFVARIMDVQTRKTRVIPHAIYSVSPNGKEAISADFRRINDVRPGYGYVGLPDPYADDLAPIDSGIVRIDLTTGDVKTILSIADVARTGFIPNEQFGIKHYFNHLLYNPDGSRFIVLHRWRYPSGSRLTRIVTATPDGDDVRIVCSNGYASHFIWKDNTHLLSQSRKFDGNDGWGNFLFEDIDGGGDVREIGRGVLDSGGHISYLPGNEWLLNDTYPKGKQRMQTPHLYHLASGRRINLGDFHLPPVYKGEWRVDTHPRLSRDGKLVCIDSPHEDQGRQLHLIDISGLIDA